MDILKMHGDIYRVKLIIVFVFQKRHYNCEKLNTSSHAKCSAAILKNPYYTPCNRDQVITPPGDMTHHISNLLHMQN
jgi:hypothetical protein